MLLHEGQHHVCTLRVIKIKTSDWKIVEYHSFSIRNILMNFSLCLTNFIYLEELIELYTQKLIYFVILKHVQTLKFQKGTFSANSTIFLTLGKITSRKRKRYFTWISFCEKTLILSSIAYYYRWQLMS